MAVFSPWMFRAISSGAFLVCCQSIAGSETPYLFSIIAAATAAIFFACKGNPAVLFVVIGAGPLVNCSVICRDPYLYNIEVVILVYTGCWFWKNARATPFPRRFGKQVSYWMLLAVIVVATVVHYCLLSKPLFAELRLIRLFIIGGFLLAFLTAAGKKPSGYFYYAVLCTTTIIAVYGLGELLLHYLHHSHGLSEPSSLFTGPEILAVYLSIVIPLLLVGRSAIADGKWAFISVLSPLSAGILLLGTRSRTAILALLFFVIAYTVSIFRVKRRGRIVIAVIAVCLVGVGLIVVGQKTFFHPAMEMYAIPSHIFSSRISPWETGRRIFIRNPLLGMGSGENYYSIYLQILCQYGIIGFVAFIIFVGSFFMDYRPSAKVAPKDFLRQGLKWSVATWLITGIGESVIGNQIGYFILFILFLNAQSPRTSIQPIEEKRNQITTEG